MQKVNRDLIIRLVGKNTEIMTMGIVRIIKFSKRLIDWLKEINLIDIFSKIIVSTNTRIRYAKAAPSIPKYFTSTYNTI